MTVSSSANTPSLLDASALARWIIRARAALASDSRSACDPSAPRGSPQVVHHGFHAVVGDLVGRRDARGLFFLLRVDFAAPVGLVGFGEVRPGRTRRRACRAPLSFPEGYPPCDRGLKPLPAMASCLGEDLFMRARRVPRRCSGRYAVGALPRLERPAALSSSAGWVPEFPPRSPEGAPGKVACRTC